MPSGTPAARCCAAPPLLAPPSSSPPAARSASLHVHQLRELRDLRLHLELQLVVLEELRVASCSLRHTTRDRRVEPWRVQLDSISANER